MAFGNPASHHVMSNKEELNGLYIVRMAFRNGNIYIRVHYPTLG